jgi:Fe-S-cluster containining protein
MMIQKRDSTSAGMDYKKERLKSVYGVYSSWIKRFPLACQKGCSACCTQSVTMTSLEGEMIIDLVRKNHWEEWLAEKLARATPGKNTARITTNQFAEACLNHWEVDWETLGSWDFTPCVFLENAVCSIYEVRPFGCRSFGSLAQCATDRAAEMAPIHLTVNTVFSQIIEHLASDNGYWSSMAEILHSLVNSQTPGQKVHLLKARPLPGFLLEPQEKQEVDVLLKRLCEHSSDMGCLGDLIDNFMLI